MIEIKIEYDLTVYSNEIKSIPDSLPGVYVLLDSNAQPIYVGQSKDVKNRLLQHVLGATNSKEYYKEIDKVSVIQEEDIEVRLVVENYLLRKYSTVRNVTKYGERISKKEGFGGIDVFGKCSYTLESGKRCRARSHSNGYCHNHGGNGISVASIQEKAVEDYLCELKNGGDQT